MQNIPETAGPNMGPILRQSFVSPFVFSFFASDQKVNITLDIIICFFIDFQNDPMGFVEIGKVISF